MHIYDLVAALSAVVIFVCLVVTAMLESNNDNLDSLQPPSEAFLIIVSMAVAYLIMYALINFGFAVLA